MGPLPMLQDLFESLNYLDMKFSQILLYYICVEGEYENITITIGISFQLWESSGGKRYQVIRKIGATDPELHP
jgi:hypothetical protein